MVRQHEEKLKKMPSLSKVTDKVVVSCMVCMNAVANVVLYPCNHLIQCEECYHRQKLEMKQEFKCILCSTEIDQKHVFLLAKKN